jgi:ATP phosphoribosyltransferase regulatory subunit
MKPPRSLIPIGTATLLPHTAQSVRKLEDRLLTHLSTWGYQEIILPTFEYFDVLAVGLAPEILEKCYKFADWASGRILVLRPDATAQIARMVAMGLGGAACPLRFSYRTTVFRYEPEHRGREREVFQVGCELIGDDSPQRDAEIVTLLAGLLERIRLPEWKISLGHVGFFKALLAQSALSPNGRKQAEIAAAHKDLPQLECILGAEQLPQSVVRTILQVPERCGGEEVLEWGKRIAGKNSHLRKPLERLGHVFRLLATSGVQEHILLDLGEFRGFDYYDGIVFDVFTSALGSEIGGGGRYNHLVGRFGRNLPAIGLGLDLDRVFSALEHGGQTEGNGSHPVVLFTFPQYAQQSFSLAQQLRRAGVCVIEETIEGSPKSPLAWITSVIRGRSMPCAILFEEKKHSQPSVLLVEFSPSSQEIRNTRVSVQEIFQRLQAFRYGNF